MHEYCECFPVTSSCFPNPLFILRVFHQFPPTRCPEAYFLDTVRTDCRSSSCWLGYANRLVHTNSCTVPRRIRMNEKCTMEFHFSDFGNFGILLTRNKKANLCDQQGSYSILKPCQNYAKS
jgi:hypothetical protein